MPDQLTPEETLDYYKRLAEQQTKLLEYWHKVYALWRGYAERTDERLRELPPVVTVIEIKGDYQETMQKDSELKP